MKDVILEQLNHFTVLAIKYGQEYSVRAQAITVDIFNRAAGFTAESAKIYGPKAQELFKVYSALLKEQGIRHGKWAFKQANVYGKLGLEYGKIWSKKALKKFQELGHAAVDRVDKFLESRREKAKKEL